MLNPIESVYCVGVTSLQNYQYYTEYNHFHTHSMTLGEIHVIVTDYKLRNCPDHFGKNKLFRDVLFSQYYIAIY